MRCYDGNRADERIYLSQSVWELVPGRRDISPNDGDSAGHETLPRKAPPGSSLEYLCYEFGAESLEVLVLQAELLFSPGAPSALADKQPPRKRAIH